MAKYMIEASADEKKVLDAFRRMAQAQDQVESGFTKGKHSSDAMASAISAIPGQIMHMAASWLSVEGAIRMATAAQEHYIRVRAEAAKAYTDAAVSEREMLRNVADPKNFAAAIKARDEVLAALPNLLGGDKTANAMMSSALGVTGGKVAPAKLAVIAAGQIAPSDPDTGRILSQVYPSMLEGLGPGATMAHAQGFGFEISRGSMSPMAKSQAENLIPAWLAIANLEGTDKQKLDPRKAGALVQTTQFLLKDVEGAITRTSVGQIAKSALDAVNKDRKGHVLPLEKRTQDVFEALDRIREDPKLKQRFYDEAQLGRGVNPLLVRKLVEPEGKKLFEEKLAEFAPRDKWVSGAKEWITEADKFAGQRIMAGQSIGEEQVEKLEKSLSGTRKAAQKPWEWEATGPTGQPIGIGPMLRHAGAGADDIFRAWMQYKGSVFSSPQEAGTKIIQDYVRIAERRIESGERVAERREARGLETSKLRDAIVELRESVTLLKESLGTMTESSKRTAETNEQMLDGERKKQSGAPTAAPAL